MDVRRQITTISKTLRSIWNTYHHIQLGVLIFIVWWGLVQAFRFVPPYHLPLPDIVFAGGISLGIALAGGRIAILCDQWRFEHHDALDDDWATDTMGAGDTRAAIQSQLPDTYEYTGLKQESIWVLGGTAIAWGLPLWVGGIAALMAVGRLFSPTVPSFNYGWLVGGGFVVSVFVTMMVAHEGLHGLVARWYGAEISFGFSGVGPYCEYTSTVISRRAMVAISLAPLVGLGTIAIACILSGIPVLVYAGVLTLLLNTVSCGGDLYQAGNRLHYPPGTKFYPSSTADGLWVFQPMENEQQSTLARLDAMLARLSAPLQL